MSRISRKSKVAALLGVLTIASSGVFAPPPAQAYPTCEDIMRRECARYWQGQPLWQIQGYPTLQACVDDNVAMTCPPAYYGPLEGVREDPSL
ncbi:MAG: hypothetical protein ACXW27_09590 [Allosphingosinicella sp.]